MNNINFLCAVINGATILLCGFFLCVMPIITRKSYLFGVKVPQEAQSCSEARELKRRYVTAVIFLTLATVALSALQYIFVEQLTLVSIMYMPFILLFGQLAIYVPTWKKALALKAEKGWSLPDVRYAEVHTSHSRGELSEVRWSYYIFSVILALASTLVLLLNYSKIPDPFPTHYDFAMNPDQWSEKTLINVLLFPLIQFGMIAMVVGVAISVVKAKLQINPEDPELSFAQHRLYRKGMGHCMGILILALSAMFSLFSLGIIWIEIMQMVAVPSLVFMILAVIPICGFQIYAGQGGGKLKPKISEKDRLAKGVKGSAVNSAQNDDKYWKLGMFYCNPEDPVWIVEDRFGANIGFNYSKPGVKVIVAIFILALVAVYGIMTWFALTNPL